MKKNIRMRLLEGIRPAVFAVAAVLSLGCSSAAFAGQWQYDSKGMYWQDEDGNRPEHTWRWIDNRCYYLEDDGYVLVNTVTPDGYTVDGTGAWTVNGVQQDPGYLNLKVNSGVLDYMGMNYGTLIETLGTPASDSKDGWWTRELVYQNPELTFELRRDTGKVWAVFGRFGELFKNITADYTPEQLIQALELTDLKTVVYDGRGDLPVTQTGKKYVSFSKDGYGYEIALIDGRVLADSWMVIR